jgi:hypothetical protein
VPKKYKSLYRDNGGKFLASLLWLFPHRQPPALVVIEPKLLDGHGFGRLLVAGLDRTEIAGALAQQRDAPGAEPGGWFQG